MSDHEQGSDGVSVDEMLERLKEKRRAAEGKDGARPRETRETVTREDGSKVVRVRRRGSRKKKSSRDESDLLRNKVMAMVISVVIVLGGGAVFGFYLFQNARLNSPDYAKGVAEKLGAYTGAEVSFNGLDVGLTKVKSREVRAIWGEQGVGRELTLSKIGGDVSAKSFIFGRLGGQTMSAASGRMIVNQPPRLLGGDYGAKIPQTLAYANFRCENLDVFFGSPSETNFKLLGTKASLEFTGESESKIFFQNGEFKASMFPEMTIQQGLINFYRNRTVLDSLVLRAPDGIGELMFSGTVLRPNQSERSLKLKITRTLAEHLTNAGMVSVIKNMRISDDEAVYHVKNDGSWVMDVNGVAEGFDLTALPIMGNLGILLNDNNLSVTAFNEETQVRLKVSPDGIEVGNIASERRGVLALKVACKVDKNKKLDGTIRVGISPRYVNRETFGAKDTFSKLEGSYYWAEVKISGDTDDPRDNSTKLFRISQVERDEVAQRILDEELRRREILDEQNKTNDDGDVLPTPGSRFDDLTR